MPYEPVPVDDLVVALLNADVALAEVLPGGAWAGEVPERIPDPAGGDRVTPNPYASVVNEGSSYEPTYEFTNLEHAVVSVTVFGVGKARVAAALREIKRVLDDTPVQVSEPDRFVTWYPNRASVKPEPARDKDGNLVYTGVLIYEYKLFRNWT